MFGKKIPNPEIEKLEEMFKDRIVTAYGHSSSQVRLAPEDFISIAKNTRTLIFKSEYANNYPNMYFIVGPDGFMYFTELDKKVKQ